MHLDTLKSNVVGKMQGREPIPSAANILDQELLGAGDKHSIRLNP